MHPVVKASAVVGIEAKDGLTAETPRAQSEAFFSFAGERSAKEKNINAIEGQLDRPVC